MTKMDKIKKALQESSYRDMTDEEKEEATKLAEHLAINYWNGVWDMSTGKRFSSEDVFGIQERYDLVKLQVVSAYEKSLNDKILKFFFLKRKNKDEKITLNDVIDIIKYKLYYKPKRKLACYLWDKPYDIYHLVK